MVHRRRAVAVFIGVLIPLASRSWANAQNQEAEFRNIAKAMWVWRTDPDEYLELLEFATRWNIRNVAVSMRPAHIDRLLSGDETIMRSLSALRSAGVAITALAGEAHWVLDGRIPKFLAKLIDLSEQFDLFDGLHFDVEPHTLDAWAVGGPSRDALMRGFLDLLKRTRHTAPALRLSAAINPVYAELTLPDGRNFLDAVAGALNSVSVMAYRNQPERTVEWVGSTGSLLERANVPWWNGVLVHQSKDKNTSYDGVTSDRFVTDMVRLHRLLSGRFGVYRSYRGLMFEDYKGLRRALEV